MLQIFCSLDSQAFVINDKLGSRVRHNTVVQLHTGLIFGVNSQKVGIVESHGLFLSNERLFDLRLEMLEKGRSLC
jgi:hypothetical protein